MANPYTQLTWRGICLLDPRWAFSAYDVANSTATQDGAEADQPVSATARGSWMQIEARGNVSTAGTRVDVKVQKEGVARGNTGGARFLWRDEGDAADEWKGWLAYNKLTSFDYLLYKNSAGDPGASTGGFQAPHGIRTPDHRAVVVYDDHENTEVRAMYQDATAGTWSHVTVYAKGSNWHAHPTICRLTGGRLLCFFILETLTEGAVTYFTVGMAYSDNNGEAWTTGAIHAGGIKINSYVGVARIGRLRVVAQADILTMVIGYDASAAPVNQIAHYVSIDLGASWDQITEASDGSGSTIGDLESWDLVALPTGSVLWVGVERSALGLRRFEKSSPYQAFDDDPDGGASWLASVDNALGTSVAACVDDEGFIWVLARRSTGLPRSRYQLVKAHADTLTKITATASPSDDLLHSGSGAATSGPNEVLDLGDDDTSTLVMSTIFPWRGYLACVSNHLGQASTKKSLVELHFGGYQSLDWKDQTWGIHDDAAPDRFGMVYVPIEVPNTIAGWTVTTSGTAPTASIVANGLNLTAAAGTYRVSRLGSTAGNPALVWIRLKVTSATTILTNDVACQIQVGDGTTGYRVSVRFSNDGVALYDDIALASVGATITGLSTATHHDYLINVENGRASVFYRDDVKSEEWIKGPRGSLSSSAGIYGNIEWGHRSNASGTFTGASQWLMVACALDNAETATGFSDASSADLNPANLVGRPFAIHWEYLTRGCQMRSVGSTGYRGDQFEIPTRYERGVQLVDPALHPSPAVMWSSTSHAAEQELHYALEGAASAGFLSSSIFLFIARPNFRTAYLEGYTGAAWVTLITIDAAAGLSGLSYVRTGNEITVDTGASQTAQRFIELDEFVDGYAVFSGSAFRIERNSEGVWTDATQRRPRFVLEGDASGVGATGSVDIVAPQVLGIAHKINTAYQRYRVRIPAATTAEGKHQAGIIMAGPVAFMGQDPDWGSVFGEEANVEISEGRDGRRFVEQRGRNRRRVEIAWPAGWDMSSLYGATPDPAYIVARNSAGYEAVGIQGDATILEGVLRRSAGGRYPIVYVPRLEPATVSSDESAYTGNRVLYGRISGSATRQVLVGTEQESEVVALSTVTIEEEI